MSLNQGLQVANSMMSMGQGVASSMRQAENQEWKNKVRDRKENKWEAEDKADKIFNNAMSKIESQGEQDFTAEDLQNGDLPPILQANAKDFIPEDVDPQVAEQVRTKFLKRQSDALQKSSAFNKLQANRAKRDVVEGRRKLGKAYAALESGDLETAAKLGKDVYNTNIRDGKVIEATDQQPGQTATEGTRFRWRNYITDESKEMELNEDTLRASLEDMTAALQSPKQAKKHADAQLQAKTDAIADAERLYNKDTGEFLGYQVKMPDSETGKTDTLIYKTKPGSYTESPAIADQEKAQQYKKQNNAVGAGVVEDQGLIGASGSDSEKDSGWDLDDLEQVRQNFAQSEGVDLSADNMAMTDAGRAKLNKVHSMASYATTLKRSNPNLTDADIQQRTQQKFDSYDRALARLQQKPTKENAKKFYQQYADVMRFKRVDPETLFRKVGVKVEENDSEDDSKEEKKAGKDTGDIPKDKRKQENSNRSVGLGKSGYQYQGVSGTDQVQHGLNQVQDTAQSVKEWFYEPPKKQGQGLKTK